MFKVPYTKDGDIRYVEVVKLFVLISLLFGLFSRFTVSLKSGPIETSSPLYIGLLGLLVVQFIMISHRETKELVDLVKSFIIPVIDIPKVVIEYIFESIEIVFTYIKKRRDIYLMLCVVRC